MKRFAFTLIAVLAFIAPIALDSHDAQAQNYPRPTVLLQNVDSGQLVTLGNKGYMVLDVTGETPTAGTKWALDVNRGATLGTLNERSGSIRGGPAAFGSVNIEVSLSTATVPTTSTNTGALSVGQVAVQSTNLWMKVQVKDPNPEADPAYIDPGAGKIWAVKLNGGTGAQIVDDDISVTRIIGVFRSIGN